MKKIIILIIAICALCMLCIGCNNSDASMPKLEVLGDVVEIVELSDAFKQGGLEKITFKDIEYKVVETEKLFENVDTVYNDNNFCFVSYDGFMNIMKDSQLKGTYIGYNDEVGFAFISYNHPPNSGIRGIENIIAVNSSDDINYDFGLNIIDGNTDENFFYSMGKLYTMPFIFYPYLDGIADKLSDGEKYTVEVYKQKRLIELTDLVPNEFDKVAIYTNDGEIEYVLNGHIEILRDQLNFIVLEESVTYRDIRGIMINPPVSSILDVFEEVKYYLEKDKKTMVIVVDGFGYSQYSEFLDDYYITSTGFVSKASSVYKPVTNAGVAAILTGQTPSVSGVKNREGRQLACDTVFDLASSLDKSWEYVEGDVRILDIDAKLNIDKNNNGTFDDEIFEYSLECLDNDLLVVHFHSYDDVSHNFGPFSEQAQLQLEIIDKYCKWLIEKFEGNAIVTADHGFHETQDGGDHGCFIAEDMFVPYIIY